MRSIIAILVLAAFLGSQVPALAQSDGSRLQDLLHRAKKKKHRGTEEEAAPAEQAAPAAGEVHETYEINAQYRGTVKKAFMDIGSASVTFATQSGGAFNIKVAGSVTDPDNKNEKYVFDVDADYRMEGNRIQRTTDRSKFNQNAERHRDRVLKDIPFIYIAKFQPYPPVSKDAPWMLDGHEYVIKYVRTEEGEMQVTALEHGSMIGKIFLETSEATPHTIKKFRVVGTNDVVLSFVQGRYQAQPGRD